MGLGSHYPPSRGYLPLVLREEFFIGTTDRASPYFDTITISVAVRRRVAMEGFYTNGEGLTASTYGDKLVESICSSDQINRVTGTALYLYRLPNKEHHSLAVSHCYSWMQMVDRQHGMVCYFLNHDKKI